LRLLIGRASDCHLRVADPRVSRHHCELLIEDNQVRIRDLGSRNGTFVNGEPVCGERTLGDGDVVYVATSLFEVQTAPTHADPGESLGFHA